MPRFSSRLSKKTLSFTTDSSFLEKVREGNEKAWFKFYRKYSGLVSYIGLQRGLSEAECEDLMTDGVFRKIDDTIGSPSARMKYFAAGEKFPGI